jgi:hypothetical protein
MALMAPTNKDRPKLKRVKCTILWSIVARDYLM